MTISVAKNKYIINVSGGKMQLSLFTAVLANLSLASVAVAAPVPTITKDATGHHFAVDAGVKAPSADPSIKRLVIYGTYNDLELTGDDACSTAFDTMFDTVYAGFPEGQASFSGGAGCSGSDGPTIDLDFTFEIEAAQPSNVEVVDAYFAAVSQRTFYDRPIESARIFAVVVSLAVNVEKLNDDDTSESLAASRTDAIFVNGAQFQTWADKAEAKFSDPTSVEPMLSWIGENFTAGFAAYLRDEILTRANYVRLTSHTMLVTENQQLVETFLNNSAYRDCRILGDTCITAGRH